MNQTMEIRKLKFGYIINEIGNNNNFSEDQVHILHTCFVSIPQIELESKCTEWLARIYYIVMLCHSAASFENCFFSDFANIYEQDVLPTYGRKNTANLTDFMHI